MADDVIRDPKALRALAHPFRWRLITLLGEEGPRTATQCAQATGESVASCSYHLNTLAKYGFVAEVAGVKGKQKPWQLVRQEQVWSGEGADDETAMAGEAASEAFLEHTFAEIRDANRRKSLEPEQWRKALALNGRLEFLTAEEVAEITAEVLAVIERYSGRNDDPSTRPEGARPVRFLLSTTVAPQRD
ncbi:MAG: helix-turn-helix transcriptional regulator [Saccharothrix sp.]|nr:helix-turn-helix transcriptional regulator [Saccharothrix sp.]